MTTGVADAHRRRLPRAVAALGIAALGFGSLFLTAVAAASLPAATPPGAAPTPTAAVAAATPTETPDAVSFGPTPATPTTTPTVAATATAALTARPTPQVRESFVALGTEPGLAADPFHPGVVAVVTQNVVMQDANNGCSRPSVRISRDGGATWGAAIYPLSYQCQDIHAMIAWGPNSRLWLGDAVGLSGGVAMAATYSDDFGKTWAARFVERFTRPWVGCFPTITVDNWPGSPNFGTVYAAYNWLPDGNGPGVAIMASRTGASWVHTEVALDQPPPGYPYAWRFGYRITAAPNGSALVSFYQSNLRSWNQANLFNEGSGANILGRGFETAVIHFDGTTLSADAPTPATSVDHWSAQFQSALAFDDSGRAWLAVENGKSVSVGHLDGSWRGISVPGMENFKPSLAIGGRTIFLGWHAQDRAGRIWTYYTLSYDGGETFLPPALLTNAVWYPGSAAGLINGVGLRENADFSNGLFYFVYGDARSGVGAYLAQIRP